MASPATAMDVPRGMCVPSERVMDEVAMRVMATGRWGGTLVSFLFRVNLVCEYLLPSGANKRKDSFRKLSRRWSFLTTPYVHWPPSLANASLASVRMSAIYSGWMQRW